MLQTLSGRCPLLRAVAIAGVTITCLQATPGEAQKRDVSFRLDWIYQGPNAGFMVAKDKGFYDEAGLNVDIGPGQRLGQHRPTDRQQDQPVRLRRRLRRRRRRRQGHGARDGRRDLPAQSDRRHRARGIRHQDARRTSRARRSASPPGGAQFQQWPAFVKGCKLDGDKIKVINVDPAGTLPALVTGQGPGGRQLRAGRGAGHRNPLPRRRRASFYYADCGVTAVSNGIIVHKDLLKQDPGTDPHLRQGERCKGFLYAHQHPDEAIAITKKFAAEIVPEIAKRELEMSFLNWETPNTAGKPIGWMSDKDWDATVEMLKQYGGVTTPLKASDLYTNEFVPAGSEFVTPPAK